MNIKNCHVLLMLLCSQMVTPNVTDCVIPMANGFRTPRHPSSSNRRPICWWLCVKVLWWWVRVWAQTRLPLCPRSDVDVWSMEDTRCQRLWTMLWRQEQQIRPNPQPQRPGNATLRATERSDTEGNLWVVINQVVSKCKLLIMRTSVLSNRQDGVIYSGIIPFLLGGVLEKLVER